MQDPKQDSGPDLDQKYSEKVGYESGSEKNISDRQHSFMSSLRLMLNIMNLSLGLSDANLS